MESVCARPRRKMPTHQAIVRHYEWLGPMWDGVPFCFGCWSTEFEWTELERAHLVDHAKDGLDGPQNLVLLCAACHRSMPSFRAGEGNQARHWVSEREYCWDRWVRLAEKAAEEMRDGTAEEDALELVRRLERRP